MQISVVMLIFFCGAKFLWGGEVSEGDKLLQQRHPTPPGRKPDCDSKVKVSRLCCWKLSEKNFRKRLER